MTAPVVTGRLAAHAGVVTEPTGAEVRATLADAARQARGVLAELTDPESELTATPATRNRLEGAAYARSSTTGSAATACVTSSLLITPASSTTATTHTRHAGAR